MESELVPSVPYVLGLDLDAKKADFCLCHGVKVEAVGQLLRENLSSFLEGLAAAGCPVSAVACEYTGGIAGPWLTDVEALGISAFVLHVSERKAYQRMDGQTHKDDQRDARGIARTLARWFMADTRESLGLPAYLFQPWSQVKKAWELRGLVADVDRCTEMATAAGLRAAACRRAGQESRALMWDTCEAAAREDAAEFNAAALSFAKEHYSKELEILVSIPFIGEKTALVLLGSFMPLERFFEEDLDRRGIKRDLLARNVLRYVGMIPRREESGGKQIRNEQYHGGVRRVRQALFIACLGAGSSQTFIGRYYSRKIVAGCNGKRAVYLTGKKVLLVALGCLRSGRRFVDPEVEPEPERPARPDYLLGGSEAARLAGCSRQALYLRRDKGKLRQEVWEGAGYFIREEIEALAVELANKEAKIAAG
jgi:transposase